MLEAYGSLASFGSLAEFFFELYEDLALVSAGAFSALDDVSLCH